MTIETMCNRSERNGVAEREDEGEMCTASYQLRSDCVPIGIGILESIFVRLSGRSQFDWEFSSERR